ncbi:hypothetical protein BTA30_15130 [Bacillus swezeyi]|uniref:Uncharacterized protein n=1 Tax=Bacillus swezeyi TaxID=1925020 RepID=A0A1R1QBG8_9BACI|nr:hypothetical protein BW143_18650 [Bacillus swezeyi]OMI28938.1 hypothetical protein BTA30_15130 [Bacillus swezeyi]
MNSFVKSSDEKDAVPGMRRLNGQKSRFLHALFIFVKMTTNKKAAQQGGPYLSRLFRNSTKKPSR